MSGFETTREAAGEEPARAEPLAPESAPGVELVRSLSRSAGNRAVSALLQRHGAHGTATQAATGAAKTTWAQVEAASPFRSTAGRPWRS